MQSTSITGMDGDEISSQPLHKYKIYKLQWMCDELFTIKAVD